MRLHVTVGEVFVLVPVSPPCQSQALQHQSHYSPHFPDGHSWSPHRDPSSILLSGDGALWILNTTTWLKDKERRTLKI